ncbi:MAG: acyltransferase family protein [Thermoleophilia bacterium]
MGTSQQSAGPRDADAHAGRRLGYMPGVDGLRAIAVVAVLIYHLGASWLPGGYLGVDVFFVISGFLITSLLLAEHRATGRIALRRFWLRRAWRLLPAVFLMLLVVLAVMLVLHHDEVGRLRGQVAAALTYVVNWHFIVADVPYFERFGRPSVFLHLWSLSIEEQFYVLWPPLLAIALPRLPRRVLVAAVAAGAAGSAALAWVLWRPFEDPSRIYYGTDTRAVALLAGAGLALLLARGRPQLGRVPLEAAGAVGLAGVVVAFLTLGDLEERLYRGGFLLVALAAAVLVFAASDPRAGIARLLGVRPMVWLGRRSYGIYLWHWPVIMLTRPGVDVDLDGAPLLAVRVALTLAAAALSYRYVETPLRRNGWGAVRAGVAAVQARFGRAAGFATASSAALAVIAVTVLVAVAPSRSGVPDGLAVPSAAAQQSGRPAAAGGPPLLFVGDSVMLVASPSLKARFGGRAVIDAQVGRTFPEGARIAQARLEKMPADTALVMHLGNNNFVKPAQIDAFLATQPPARRIYLVTVRVPLPWQDSVNAALRDARDRHPDVSLIDWYAASGGPGLLVDGAHTNARGGRLYARVIAEALASTATR